MKKILLFILIFSIFNSYSLNTTFINKLDTNYENFPTPIKVPTSHPRVYITPEDITDIKNKLETDQNIIDLWNQIKSSNNNNNFRLKSLSIYDKVLNSSEINDSYKQGNKYNHQGNENLTYYKDYLIGDLNINNFPETKGSMSFWIYLYTDKFTKNINLIDRYRKTGNHIFVRAYDDNKNKSNLQIAFQNLSSPYPFVKNLNLSVNNWHNIVIQWDTENGEAEIYLNGKLQINSEIKDPNWTPNDEKIVGSEISSTYILIEALKYLLEDNDEACKEVINEDLKKLKLEIDARTIESQAHYSAMIYDWCYPVINSTQKQEYINEFIRIASLHSPWYPADESVGSVIGHGQEGWLLTFQLPAGLAIYDEDSTMFDSGSKLLFNSFVEVRNYFYPGHFYHQGDSYFGRFVYDQLATLLFKKINYKDILSREQQFVPYSLLYGTRSDFQQIKKGDTYNDLGIGGRLDGIYSLTSNYYDDLYLNKIYNDDQLLKNNIYTIFRLLFQKNFEEKPLEELPKTKYFKEPAGEMIVRTGWTIDNKNIDEALTFMRIGGTYFGNHQKRDFGTFQMYYKGGLAIRSGIYGGSYPDGSDHLYGSDHWKNYAHQTLAHNGLLIYDPNEELIGSSRIVNSGGQLIPNEGKHNPNSLDMLQNEGYEMGEVLAYDIKPNNMNPEFSYISGDITNAYSDKVNFVKRSMITFNLNSTKFPQSLVVFDIINSTNKSFKKTWLLHSMEEPTINENEIEIKRIENGYSGRLKVKTFYPENPLYEKIGGPGKEFWVKETNTNYLVIKSEAEAGNWRIELSPSQENIKDYFLNVLTVSDSNENTNPKMNLLENENVVGVNIEDRVVLFSKSKNFLDSLNFNLSLIGNYKILFCDLNPGMWEIKKNGEIIYDYFRVEKDSKCAYFENSNGYYELNKVNSNIIKGINKDEFFWNELRYNNLAPEIIKPSVKQVKENETLIFDININEPENDDISAFIYNEDASLNTDISIDSISSNKVTLSWTPNSNDLGMKNYYLVIEDNYYVVDQSFRIEVLEVDSNQTNETQDLDLIPPPTDDDVDSKNKKIKNTASTFTVTQIQNISINEDICIPQYIYYEWSLCEGGLQSQFIEDINFCSGDILDTRVCQSGLSNQENLILNAKKINISKFDYKKYESNLDSTYNGIFYVDERLEDNIFLLKNNNTNEEYLGQYFDTIEGNVYYTLKRIDEGIITILQDEGILDLEIKKESSSNLYFILGFIIFGILLGIYFFKNQKEIYN